jgi:hypothetical protein
LIVDLQKFRDKKFPYLSEEEIWEQLIDLTINEMLIITKYNGKLRVAKVRAEIYQINPEDFDI